MKMAGHVTRIAENCKSVLAETLQESERMFERLRQRSKDNIKIDHKTYRTGGSGMYSSGSAQ